MAGEKKRQPDKQQEGSRSALDSSQLPSVSPSRATQNPPEYLIVGQVVAPFGIAGEMKVNVLTEFPERFEEMDEVVLAPYTSIDLGSAPPNSLAPAKAGDGARGMAPWPKVRNRSAKAPSEPTTFEVVNTRMHKSQLLLRLVGIDSADAVEPLRGYWVVVPLGEAKKLPRGAYYLYQIVGLDVYTTERRHIGKVADVLTLTANDVYVVRGPGVTDPSGELLVPAIKSVVKRMEMKRGRIVIVPPEQWS